MADKSPHDNHHAQKSGKSIKQKRAERRAKAEPVQSQMTRLTSEPKRHG
jgi:hypothetical protein